MVLKLNLMEIIGEVSKRISRLSNENAFVVLAEVAKLKEQGRGIINFRVGEPDFRREYV